MDKNRSKTEEHDEQFPSQLLYSSPPEAASLTAWVRDIDHKRGKNGSTATNKAENE